MKKLHSNSILERNRVVGHQIRIGTSHHNDLSWKYENPFQPLNAPNLIKLMFHLNKRRGYNMPRPFVTYLREINFLIKKYGAEMVEKAMFDSFKQVTRNGWGLKYVRRILDVET